MIDLDEQRSREEAAIESAATALAESNLGSVVDAFLQVDPEALSESERYHWCLMLIEAGARAHARSLFSRLTAPRYRKAVSAILLDWEEEPRDGGDGDLETEQPKEDASDSLEADENDPFEVDLGPARKGPEDEELVNAFLRWFGGRRDIYSLQWHDAERKRGGYRPVHAPLTPEVVRGHLSGRHTIGQYLLFPDATVSFACIDLDLSGSAMAELRAGHGEDVSPLAHARLAAHANRLMDAARRLGLVLTPEDSGGKGLHLWVFFEPRRPARAARMLLSRIVSAAGPQPPDVGVELFPKQDRLGPRGLSSLVKLPLGIHQASLRRCHLLDEGLRPIEDAMGALSRISAASPVAVDGVVGHQVVPLPAPELQAVEPLPDLPKAHSARSLAEALRQVPEGGEQMEACDRMISGCRVLEKLSRKALETHRLEPAEARALLYSVGLVGPATGLITELFAAANVSFKELERVRRGLPSPVGCNKLRRFGDEPRMACRCFSDEEAQPYHTPALFAVGSVAPSPPKWRPFAPWMDEDAPTVQDPLTAFGEILQRIESRLERLEGTSEATSDPEEHGEDD